MRGAGLARPLGALRRRASRRRVALTAFLAVLGPGVITGFAGNEAGGVTTYSSVGAQFGYSLLWLLLVASIGLGVIQEMCSRMGLVTGQGLSDLIRERFGVRWTILAMVVLIIANGTNVHPRFRQSASYLIFFSASAAAMPAIGACSVRL